MWIAIVIVISIVIVVIILSKRMNNYIFIARNTTFINEILKNDFKDCFPDDNSLLATTALVDALVYIQKGQLTIDDIKRGVLAASIRKCRIGITSLDIFRALVEKFIALVL